jgi:hypothetical protein
METAVAGLNYHMQRLLLIFTLILVSFCSSGQRIYGVGYIDWSKEPDYADKDGYNDFPYNTPRVNVKRAPTSWQPVNSIASFDTTWNLIVPENFIAKPTNTEGGDLFDLRGQGTFGASWKALHDGKYLYVLLKYVDKNGIADAGSVSFDIMAQPVSPFRHEVTFQAAGDSTAEKTISKTDQRLVYRNMAYARAAELGGGRAVFRDGHVSEYSASVGMIKNAWQNYYAARWGANQAGQDALQKTNHFWNASGGVIRAVLVMSFDGALSYPVDPATIYGARRSVKVGDTIAFDVKSSALRNIKKVEYFWSADRNNGFASNYYSGQLRLSGTDLTVLNAGLIRQTDAFYHDGSVYMKSGQPADLEIYNLLGIRVKDARCVNRLNIEDLKDGIYLVRISGEQQTVKIVKSGR